MSSSPLDITTTADGKVGGCKVTRQKASLHLLLTIHTGGTVPITAQNAWERSGTVVDQEATTPSSSLANQSRQRAFQPTIS